ncbi:MAG: 30S ribosome-binding factor RbfA [Sporichthyaceae bacterium]|nr:30S ribosome-binding factor RbfA [Sporichthyaceae bacterium]
MARPSYPRARRLAETVRRLVTEWLEQEHAADRLDGLLTITNVRVTPDLHHATVYYTVLGGGQEQTGTGAALAEATKRARTYVARHVRLRHAPTLEFVSDEVPGRGARIDQLLADIHRHEPGDDRSSSQEGTQR